MSRIISTRRFASSESLQNCRTNKGSDGYDKHVLDACLEVHRLAMGLISCSIANEREPGASDPEMMALLLASAQTCQSFSTLLRLKSEHTTRMAEACRQICLSCAETCAELQASTAGQNCAQACLACAEACTIYLKSQMTEATV